MPWSSAGRRANKKGLAAKPKRCRQTFFVSPPQEIIVGGTGRKWRRRRTRRRTDRTEKEEEEEEDEEDEEKEEEGECECKFWRAQKIC